MESLNLFCFCIVAPIGCWCLSVLIGRALRGRQITFNRVEE